MSQDPLWQRHSFLHPVVVFGCGFVWMEWHQCLFLLVSNTKGEWEEREKIPRSEGGGGTRGWAAHIQQVVLWDRGQCVTEAGAAAEKRTLETSRNDTIQKVWPSFISCCNLRPNHFAGGNPLCCCVVAVEDVLPLSTVHLYCNQFFYGSCGGGGVTSVWFDLIGASPPCLCFSLFL